MPIYYQSANPIPICGQSVNPLPIRQSLTNLPISDQSIYPMPTLDQADMTVFQQQPLHTHICHNHRNYTVTSSIANTCQSYVNASGICVHRRGTRSLCWTQLLVSTEDDFTPIPVANLHSLFQSRTIHASLLKILDPSTNPMPIYWSSVNPTPTHKYKSITHPPLKYQCYTKLPIHYQSTNQCTYPLNQSNPLVLDHPANSPTQCQSEAYLTILVRQPSNPIKTESAS